MAALIAVLSVAVAALGIELFYMHRLRSIVAAGNRQLLGVAPDQLDRDLRAALPPGTPRGTVEAALRGRHVEFTEDSGRHRLRAEARNLKGSNPFVDAGLILHFQFDQNEMLTRIDSRVVNTGT
jgi:hypothetical protein